MATIAQFIFLTIPSAVVSFLGFSLTLTVFQQSVMILFACITLITSFYIFKNSLKIIDLQNDNLALKKEIDKIKSLQENQELMSAFINEFCSTYPQHIDDLFDKKEMTATKANRLSTNYIRHLSKFRP